MSTVLMIFAAAGALGLIWSAYCAWDYRREALSMDGKGRGSAREGLINRSREYYALARDYRHAGRWHTSLAVVELVVLSLAAGWLVWA